MNVAIVEDDSAYSNQLKAFVEDFERENSLDLTLEQFPSGLAFLEACKTTHFSIVFMDIILPELDGLEISRRFRNLDQTSSLIFVTNMAQYAINGYDVGALDFLVKPVTYTNLCLKINKALKIQNQNPNRNISLKSEGGLLLMNINDIYYVESFAHYLDYHTKKGVITVRESMGEAEASLRSSAFKRCQRSYLVNTNYLTRLDNNSIFVKDADGKEKEIPLSRGKKKEFLQEVFFPAGEGKGNA